MHSPYTPWKASEPNPPSQPSAGTPSSGDLYSGASKLVAGDVHSSPGVHFDTNVQTSAQLAQVYATGQPPKPVKQRREVAGLPVLALVLVAVVSGLIGAVLSPLLFDLERSRVATIAVTGSDAVADPSRPADSIAGIASQVIPSVVYIEAATSLGGATGTGFVYSAEGHILTNSHVIEDPAQPDGASTRIFVIFEDGTREPATVVGRTGEYDIAVLKVERNGLQPLVLGDSDSLVVGDTVIAVGAPLGLNGTVTTGIVSALNRPVTAGDMNSPAFINAIQTDAAINPGNSGGPLVNARGEVIGINSAIAQPPGRGQATGSIGLGFAIPSNQVKRTAGQLIETGVATYPVIGVLLDGTYQGEGVQIVTAPVDGTLPITPGGPGDRAGLRPGDIIVAIDGRPVTSNDELIVAIRAKSAGDTVLLTVRSAGVSRDVEMVLDETEAR